MKTKLTLIMAIAGFFCANAQSWTWLADSLTFARDGLSATVLDDSIFYSGGRVDNGVFYNIVEIYDIGEDSWSYAEPQSPDRWQTNAVSANGMVFIAGGNDYNPDIPFTWYADIDVFNKETGEWTVETLSEGRIFMGSVAHGNKVFFAGGISLSGSNYNFHDEVDIYDTETGTWDAAYLSVGRWAIGAAVAGDKVFFAGGGTDDDKVSDIIDIYDTETGLWSVEHLSVPRAFTAAVTYGDSVFFAGGTLTDYAGCEVIDIYNVDNEEWVDNIALSGPRIVSAHKVYDALVFTGWCDYFDFNNISAGNLLGTVNIYYPETGTWELTVPDLDPVRHWFAHTSYDKRVYFAGGRLGGGGDRIPTINILEYDPTGTGISVEQYKEFAIRVFPNPFTSQFSIDYKLQHTGKVNITIYNNIGEQVQILMDGYQPQGNHQVIFDSEKLKPGVYFCTLKTNSGVQSTKMIKL